MITGIFCIMVFMLPMVLLALALEACQWVLKSIWHKLFGTTQ